MISTTLQDAVNKQIRNELASSYLYLAMSAYFESANLPGFSKWMRRQSEEETEHAMKLYDFLHERGGRVVLQAITAPPAEFGSPTDAFKAYLAHEKEVTAMINALYAAAVKENDYSLQVHLHWFINEQVEEEKSGEEIIAQLGMAGDNKSALMMIDRALGERASKD